MNNCNQANIIIILEFSKYNGDRKFDFDNNKVEMKAFKERILSSLSHELKTPLNCSIQLLDLLF